MSLQKLARELDETARQTASMLEGITEALEMLADKQLSADPTVRQAVQHIITALQGQDRIEQRCRNMADAARKIADLSDGNDAQAAEGVWSTLTLDELRDESLSGIAARTNTGEVEFF